MNLPMSGPGPGRSAFTENVDTRHLVAVHSSQPIAGGIRYAQIGARFPYLGGYLEVLDFERFHGRVLKTVARCLGFRRGPELIACPVCAEAEDFAALEAAHLGGRSKTLDDLVKNGECHLFAMFSDELLDPEAKRGEDEVYKERLAALKACDFIPAHKDTPAKPADHAQRQWLLSQWGGMPKAPAPARIVGLIMPASLSGRFDTR